MQSLTLILLIFCVSLLSFLSSKDATASQTQVGHVPISYLPAGMMTKESTTSSLQYIGAIITHGDYHLIHGRYYEAIAYYDKALQNDPNNLLALIGKGYSLDRLGKYDYSISCLDKALKIYPHNAYAILFKEDALYGKAVSLVSLGKYNEAVIYYDEILKIDSKFVLTETDLKIIHKFSK